VIDGEGAASANVLAHHDSASDREADGNHEGQETKRAEDCLCGNSFDGKVRGEQRENVEGPPAPNSHSETSESNRDLAAKVSDSLSREDLNISGLFKRRVEDQDEIGGNEAHDELEGSCYADAGETPVEHVHKQEGHEQVREGASAKNVQVGFGHFLGVSELANSHSLRVEEETRNHSPDVLGGKSGNFLILADRDIDLFHEEQGNQDSDVDKAVEVVLAMEVHSAEADFASTLGLGDEGAYSHGETGQDRDGQNAEGQGAETEPGKIFFIV